MFLLLINNNHIYNILTNLIIYFVCVVHANRNPHFNDTALNLYNMEDCGSNEFYDVNYLTCTPCDQLGGDLQPSDNKFSCVCKSFEMTSVTIHVRNSPHMIHCTDFCRNKLQSINTTWRERKSIVNLCKKVRSMNKTYCKYKYINSTKSHNYTSNQIEISFVNRYVNGECDECDPSYNYRYRGYCIVHELMKPYLILNSFGNSEAKFAAFFCISLHNRTACNNLANLCVASFYSTAVHSPCNQFLKVQRNAMEYNMIELTVKPFLFYPEGKSLKSMLNNNIDGFKDSFDVANQQVDELSLFNTIQDMNGHLMERGLLKLWHLNLCCDSINIQTIRLAQPFETIKCFLTVRRIIDLALTRYNHKRFYNLYFQYTFKGKQFLCAIPLLIKNLVHENQFNTVLDWLLVRRFQLIQLHDRYNNSFIDNYNKPTVYNDSYYFTQYGFLRYVDKIILKYVIHENDFISVPIITLNYRQIEIHNNTSLSCIVPFEFAVTFNHHKNNNENVNLNNKLLMLGILGLSIIIAVTRSIFYRNHYLIQAQIFKESIYIRIFIELSLDTVSTASIICIIYFVLSIWWLFFKCHSKVCTDIEMLNTKEKWFICAAALLELFYICITLYRKSLYDIYIIDWERHRYGYTRSCNLKYNQHIFASHSTLNESSISTWRSILVVNKWIQLSSQWVSSPSYILQFVLIYAVFMIFCKSNVLNGNHATLFIIVNSYIIIYIIQYFCKSLILERLCRNCPIQQFLDLCTKSNISLFILVHPYYGFYIHGRSPNGFTDTYSKTITSHLPNNASDVYKDVARGLLNDNDQCFVIIPPSNLNHYLRKLRTCDGISQKNGIHLDVNKMSIYRNNLNHFFCSFIDHNIKDIDYIIKDQTFVERRLNCKLYRDITETKGIFYKDHNNTFKQILLYGNEFRFFCLLFSMFLTIYVIFNNLFLSTIAAYILYKILRFLFDVAVKHNILRKTFTDKRLFNLWF